MSRERVTSVGVVALGLLYLVAGIGETVRAVVTGDGGLGFWFGTLVGASALVLVGQVLRDRPWTGGVLVVLGALLGVPATAWTVVVPVFAVVVAALAVVRAGMLADERSG